MQVLYLSLSIAYTLLVWFQTDTVLTYLRLFLPNLLKDKSLLETLNSKWPNNFLVKLISCPICLSFWFSLIACSFYKLAQPFVEISTVSFLSCLFYFISALLLKYL